MARLSRIESKERTRAQLLAAGKAEFLRLGYAGATLDGIAEAAGYSKGAVYSNFASKEDMFLELLRIKLDTDLAVIAAALDTEQTVGETLDQLYAYLATAGDDILDFTLLATEFLSQAGRTAAGEECARLYAGQREGLASFLGRLFERADRTPPAPLADMGATFVSITLGVALQRGLDRSAISATRWAAITRQQLDPLLR